MANKKSNRQIQGLPQGWKWVSVGQETWTTSTGATSTAKHAIDPTGKRVSLRQAQNLQREARAAQGQPKPPSIPRTGKSRTIKYTQGLVDRTKGGKTGTSLGVSLYSPERHGQAQSIVFYDFDGMKKWVEAHPLNDMYKNVTIQIRYTERLSEPTKTDSDPTKKGGYATLTPFRTADFFNDTVTSEQANFGDLQNPWLQAEQKLGEFDMSGKNARIYLYMSER